MKNLPRINIVVCGVFHYRHYVAFLAKKGILVGFYYSYKVGFFGRDLRKYFRNFFLKEYLMYAHLKILSSKFFNQFLPFYHFVWKLGVTPFFNVAPVNLFMLHGNCLPLIKKAKKARALVIGEAVNAHPSILDSLLESEYAALGLPYRTKLSGHEEIIAETKLIDYLLVPSSAVGRSYCEMGFSPEKIIVLPYGVKNEILPRPVRAVKGKVVRVVSIGQVSVRKGFHHLLNALEDSDDAKFDITIVGAPQKEYFDYLKTRCRDFHHIPHVVHDEILDKLADFDVFVLASIEDGFAMVVTEALEAGLPVVVSEYVGASEVIKECGGGIVVSPTEYQALRKAVINCARGNYVPLHTSPKTWAMYADDICKLTISLDDFRSGGEK